jgi:hypothetical protein
LWESFLPTFTYPQKSHYKETPNPLLMGQRYNFNFDAKEEEKVAITDPLHCLE